MVRAFFKWLFGTPPEPRAWWQIIVWWETRRIPYNVFVGVLGVVCLETVYLLVPRCIELGPGEDIVEPLLILAAPFVVNLAYTGGWIAELTLRLAWRQKDPVIGPILLKLGVSFSTAVILFPVILWLLVFINHITTVPS